MTQHGIEHELYLKNQRGIRFRLLRHCIYYHRLLSELKLTIGEIVMEEITNTCFSATTAKPTAKQPRPFVLALILTGLLYFAVKPSQPSKADVTVGNIAGSTTNVSQPVANAVLHDLSMHSGLPKSGFRIIKAQSLSSVEDCLSLSNSKRLCTQTVVPGWHITVANGSRRWFYHTNKTGSVVHLQTKISSPSKEVKGDAIATNFRF